LTETVNRALIAHGAQKLIVPAAAAGEFLDGTAMLPEARVQEALFLMPRRNVTLDHLDLSARTSR